MVECTNCKNYETNELVLEDDIHFTQIDNEVTPKVACFPTSMGMGMIYCLQQLGLDKTSVGCPDNVQIEDYINKLTSSPETLRWIKNKGVAMYGKWMLETIPRGNFYVEEYIFNKLMNPLGYKCNFLPTATYNQYCDLMEKNKLPIIIRGKFRPETKVSGHLICGIGFNKENKSFIVNDPFGNALENYKLNSSGENLEYPCNHWFKREEDHIWIISLSKI